MDRDEDRDDSPDIAFLERERSQRFRGIACRTRSDGRPRRPDRTLTKRRQARPVYGCFSAARNLPLGSREPKGQLSRVCGGDAVAAGSSYRVAFRDRVAIDALWLGSRLCDGVAVAVLADALERARLPEVLVYTAADNVRSRAVIGRLQMRRDPARDFTTTYPDVGDWTGLVWVTPAREDRR